MIFGYSICTSNSGAVYSTGTFADTANFDPDNVGYYLYSHGQDDAFIQKIAQCYSAENVALGGITYSLLNNDSVQFAATNLTNAEYYYWSFGDGTFSDEANPIHAYTNSGQYTVTLVVSNDCGTSDSASINIDVYPTGIQKITQNSSTLKIFPNPTKDILFVVNESEVQMSSLTIYNVLGKKVFENQSINSFKYSLKTNNLITGNYFIKVLLKNGHTLLAKFQKVD